MNWLNFSGAPAMLLAERALGSWAGSGDVDWRDYNRACEAAWPGRGVINVEGTTAFVFYTETDTHTWIPELLLYASGGWVPDASELELTEWESPVDWEATEGSYVLVNSAADLRGCSIPADTILVKIFPGKYRVEYAEISGEYVGQFARFRKLNESR